MSFITISKINDICNIPTLRFHNAGTTNHRPTVSTGFSFFVAFELPMARRKKEHGQFNFKCHQNLLIQWAYATTANFFIINKLMEKVVV